MAELEGEEETLEVHVPRVEIVGGTRVGVKKRGVPDEESEGLRELEGEKELLPLRVTRAGVCVGAGDGVPEWEVEEDVEGDFEVEYDSSEEGVWVAVLQ